VSFRVLKPGLQTTVQAGPRTGMRHLGVPASGAADPLSLALANKLVGNPLLAPALETTLTGVSLAFDERAYVAISGAKAKARINGERVKLHRTFVVGEGDELEVGPARAGARNYVAFGGGIDVPEVLGSASTYLPAGFGGHEGRALRAGDSLSIRHRARRPAWHCVPAMAPRSNCWTSRDVSIFSIPISPSQIGRIAWGCNSRGPSSR
jgi:biotin-dependent carboxylase-like uncharacterized protein